MSQKTDKRRILFNTQFAWPYVSADYVLAMGLQQRGHEVLMLACGGGLPHYCELETSKQARPECAGCLRTLRDQFVRFGLPSTTVSEHLQKPDYELADRLRKDLSVEALLRYELLGVPVGQLARLNLFQYYHGFPFSIRGKKETAFRNMFHSAVLYTLAKKRLFDLYQPDLVVTVNGKFLQWAPLVIFARQKGCDYVTWEDLHLVPSGIALALNGIAHEQRIDAVWAEESQKALTESQRAELRNHFGMWADGKVSQFRFYGDDADRDPQSVRRRLGLASGRPTVSLFTNVSWDSTSVGYEGAFSSMYDWIFSCVDYALAHPEINLVVRSHPAEVNVPEFYQNEVGTCQVIRERYGTLPDHIKLVEPGSSISSYAVAELSDVCMVYTSTLALELALQGKPVWVAANAYYSGKGFTTDLTSREDLYRRLDCRPFKTGLTPEQVALAERFAYMVRLRRVFSAPYLDARQGRFDFPGFEAFAPGGNPVVENMCRYVLTGRPFLDIGRPQAHHTAQEPAEADRAAGEKKPEIVFGNLKIRYDSLPALHTEIRNIFEQKIYDFETDNPSPLVIDGGAHLGLFSLYVKQKYPNARILAFEPDGRSFDLLNANLAANQIKQVRTFRRGLYSRDTVLRFAGDGADGGAIQADGEQEIQTVRLSEYLQEPVDYLKLNIEGAELDVLEEIEPHLHRVRQLCLEYHGFPEIGQRLHEILALLSRNGFRYLIHDFDRETNPATKPPFSIDSKTRFFLLIYARRILQRSACEKTRPDQSTQPISRTFGFDRGTPIDRIFIDRFLSDNKRFIRGRAMEIAESTYTRKFDSGVTAIDVLHAEPGNPQATLIGNLETGENIPPNRYDCIILTQTLHVIYDYRSVLRHCYNALRENGVLLLTAPGISQISRYDMDRWGDYWRFTTLSLKRIMGEFFGPENVEITHYGNYRLAAEFLNGRAAEELPAEMFSVTDDDYQLLLGAAAVRKAAVGKPAVTQSCASRPQPLVLLYHRVADDPLDSELLAVSPDHFREHLTVLKEQYRVVPLRQLLAEAQTGRMAPNTAALTFDDGYLDNLTEALPLLEAAGLHATIFITADAVERSAGFWWDKLEFLFLGAHDLPGELVLQEANQEYRWLLNTPSQRLAAYDQMAGLLRARPAAEIDSFVQGLFRWAQIRDSGDSYKPILTIRQLQTLSQSPCIEIGSHTLSHTRLSALPVEVQAREILESKRKLESWIGKPVTILSYPYGSSADFTEQTKALVRQAGYQYGIANSQGSVGLHPDPFAVPRRLVRNWTGEVFAGWMRAEDQGLLEQQTIERRESVILQSLSGNRKPSRSAAAGGKAGSTPKVVLCTLWRSGTHWLGSLLSEVLQVPWIYEPFGSGERKQELSNQLHHSDEGMIRVMHIPCEPDLFFELSDPLGFKVLFLHRDVRDVLASNVKMRKYKEGYRPGLPPFPDMTEEEILRWDLQTYGPLFRQTLPRWISYSSANLLTLTYENLKRDTRGMLGRILAFLNVQVTEEQMEQAVRKFDFQQVTRRAVGIEDKTAVARKGIIGDYKNQFTPQQMEMIEQCLR